MSKLEQRTRRTQTYGKAKITRIVKQVCKDYGTGEYTLASCCDAAGVPVRMFHYWMARYRSFGEDIPEKWQYFTPLAQLYAQAREVTQLREYGELVERAETGLMKLVSGYEVEETHTEAKTRRDNDGQEIVVPTGIKKFKKVVGPNVTAIQYVLTNLNPDKFRAKTQVTNVNVDANQFKDMSDEEIDAEITRLEKEL